MDRKRLAVGLVGLLGVVVAVLGSLQLVANQQTLERGQESAVPSAIADTGTSRLCANAALEQYAETELAWALSTLDAGGFTWVRQRFPWSEIEVAPEDFRWERWDRIVAGAVAQGLQIIPVLESPPDWAGMPPDPEAFAHFAGAFANHYMAQMVYYEVWHNPNLGDSWGGQADPFAYTELLSLGAEAIRASDPDARIVLGSLAPNVESGPDNYSESNFLEMLYVAGAAPYFDVVAVQPYGFYSGPDDLRVDPQVFNFSRPILIREVLEAHGEGDKAVWASHFGWNSLPESWEGPVSIWGSVDEVTQAENTVAALERAEQTWPWMGVMCVNGFQPRPAAERAIPDAEEHWGFALVGPDGVPRPAFEALQAWAARPRKATAGIYPAGTELADFEGTWRLGPQGVDIGQSGDKVSLEFEGTGVALTVRRGPYRAFLFVTVDGQPAPALPRDEEGRAYVVLYDPLAEIATVPLARHLPYGVHTVEVTAERGWGQWALADWRVLSEPDRVPYFLGLAGFVILGCAGGLVSWAAARRIDWHKVSPRLRALLSRLSAPARTVSAVVLTAIFGAAAWMTWAQGPFRRLGDEVGMVSVLLAATLFYLSPWLVVTLISGAILFLLVFIYPSLGLALTIAAAPFYLHPVSLFGKSFSLSELILLPTLVGWLVQLLAQQRHAQAGKAPAASWRTAWAALLKVPSFYAVLAFVGVALVSSLLADHLREALREFRLVVIEPVLFYLALVTLPMEKRERWRIIDAFVASAVVVAAIGLVQYFILGDVITAEGGIPRLRSIYGSPNNVGLYLGRIFPILLAVGLWGGRDSKGTGTALSGSRRWLFYGLAGLPVGLALLLSLSRGAILLGIPAAMVTLGVSMGGRWKKATLVALVIFALALIPLFQTPRFAGLFDASGGTTFLRLALWHSAWQMALDHPVLGVGLDNFLYAYRTRYVLPTAWEEFNLSHPHNWVLDFGSRLGILGLLTFLWLQVTFWLRAFSLRFRCPTSMMRALGMGLMAAMAAALAHGLVDAMYFYIDLAYSFFLLVAAVTWLREGQC